MALTKLTTNLISGDIVTSVNGSSGAVTLETGTDWQTAIQTNNFTAVASKGYFVNTTSAEITVTLPVGVVGTEIVIQDYAGTFATNNIILTANGSEKIQGVTDDFKCSINNATITLIYQDATKGWTAANIAVVVSGVLLSYLVVAGGGSGASGASGSGGGGGAGGYRTNYLGTTLTLAKATNYTVTIGGGGAVAGLYENGNNGSNSVFHTITSTGGGAGGYNTTSPDLAEPGGSGGGGAGINNNQGSGGAGNTPSTTPSQGNTGGTGFGATLYAWSGGGGGGAGIVGVTATSNSPGNGGAGTSNAITGTALFYAGGGGGGSWTAGTSNGTGGSGIGGNGGKGTGSNGASGSANRGAGGGGGGQDSAGGAGGSGIVILRYPNSFDISGLSGTTTTVGTDKVTTFTNTGTGNIQFNTP